jgi:hypothetical protein
MLEKEFKYYTDNQQELLKKYNGKFIVIKAGAVEGNYNTHIEAYEASKQKFELGTFLIQHCAPGTESYTQTFHSRVFIGKIAPGI